MNPGTPGLPEQKLVGGNHSGNQCGGGGVGRKISTVINELLELSMGKPVKNSRGTR